MDLCKHIVPADLVSNYRTRGFPRSSYSRRTFRTNVAAERESGPNRPMNSIETTPSVSPKQHDNIAGAARWISVSNSPAL